VSGSAIRLQGGISILAAFFALSLPAAADDPREPSGGLVAAIEVPEPVDGISAEQRAEIQAAIDAYERRHPERPRKDEGPFLYPFFPQAGILGRDLFLNNFTDQDPSTGLVRDWDCSDYTYDGHQGHDSLIRSFREQAIGVPVFAVRDGVVVDTHDGEPDMNTEWNAANKANYVIIDHGDGYMGWYFHFKRDSVAVSPGQAVTAGTQLGLTGSSGFSNWPHLHFETRKDNQWIEPSAGPCRSGDSLWVSQPLVFRDFYVADFYMAQGVISIPDIDAYLLDETPRTATFVKGFQTVGERVDLRNLPGDSTFLLRVLTPRGQVAFEGSGAFSNRSFAHLAYGSFFFNLDLDTVGVWRFELEINDALVVSAPFRVVATARQLTNRPPNRITARLSPPHPVEGEVLTCEVQTSLITEDPDYDLVSYRYEWRVNNRVVRSVTSAALTDLLAAGVAKPKDRVSCRVTPADRKSSGKSAAAVTTVEGREATR